MTRTPIPLRRKLIYALLVTCVILAAIEGASRLFVGAAATRRWHHNTLLLDTIGFPQLAEVLEPDDDLFWRLKPNVEPRRLTGTVADSGLLSFDVSTDAHGRRRTPGVPEAQPTILFLGDSCTFGIGVNDDETFAALLQQRLPARCLNAGVPGYTSYQGRKALESARFTTPPDVTVVEFLFNDNSHWDDHTDPEFAKSRRGLGAWLIRNSRFVGLLAQLGPQRRPDDVLPRRQRLSDAEYGDQLRTIVARCHEMGSSPILLIWPTRDQIARGTSIAKQEVMRSVGRDLGLPVVDLVPAFRSAGGTRLFLDVVHTTTAGHEIVADELLAVLRRTLGRR